ncbi:N(4)-acetylcytidine aminohydrolase [Shewanella waksmanii]|uniref:N(4)-acetylcytidine aminohydrolase n=1 Tax=Shewanella waksmanii TaxID=213783 RepID=UPI000490ABD7|nr:N(4)-acetylcytidine aminohydrolase [Shewanella waksmanii]
MPDIAPSTITFFEFLTPLVASGKKTITIRDEAESHYVPGTQVAVFTLETQVKVCDIEILSVEPILFSELNQFHAEQEYLPLDKLKQIIRDVYPDTEQLYVISFKLI